MRVGGPSIGIKAVGLLFAASVIAWLLVAGVVVGAIQLFNLITGAA